ncbi:MAG: hypothetical protein GX816_04270 [Erysipelotrichia bacterium]|jgi:hypothetical protein|nr:hypothetical protein [Erysipelotrichia bacterium]
MNKELEALNYLVSLAVAGNRENHRGKIFESQDIIKNALKRNEPVTPIGVRHYNGIVERGLCPVCRMETYTGDKYCCECGTKFDKDWSDEK